VPERTLKRRFKQMTVPEIVPTSSQNEAFRASLTADVSQAEHKVLQVWVIRDESARVCDAANRSSTTLGWDSILWSARWQIVGRIETTIAKVPFAVLRAGEEVYAAGRRPDESHFARAFRTVQRQRFRQIT
jgi:hypothetical protein